MKNSRVENNADGQTWLTPEARRQICAIRGPHRQKKITTVIRLAFAMANQEPLNVIFTQPDTVTESVWYQRWRHLPDVAAALAAVYDLVRETADAETIRQEEFHRRERRRSVARYASQAPAALAAVMTGADQKGSDRINAAVTLVRLADGQDAQPVAAGSEVRSESNVGVEIRPINYRAAIASLAPTEAGSVEDSAASSAD